jgi:hypothetical protein
MSTVSSISSSNGLAAAVDGKGTNLDVAAPAAVAIPGIAPYSRPHPLLLPEIVSTVMEFLAHDKRALCAAVRAHPTCAAHGLRLLWSRVRDIALVRVAEVRRHLYARHIEALTLSALHTFGAGLEFPRLRHVTLLTNYRDAMTDDSSDDDDSDSLADREPISDTDDSDDDAGLHRFNGNGSFGVSDDRKAEQLDELCCWLPPSVTSIRVAGDDDRVDAKLLCCFAQRPNLAALVLRPAYLLSAEHMRAVLDAAAAVNAAVPDDDVGDGGEVVGEAEGQKAVARSSTRREPPFVNLRSFEGRVAADAVPLLAKALRQRTTRLKLSVERSNGSASSSCTDVLSVVCSVHALTELTLSLRDFTLSNADIALLRVLKSLRVLAVSGEPSSLTRGLHHYDHANSDTDGDDDYDDDDDDMDFGFGIHAPVTISSTLVAPGFSDAELRALLRGGFGQQLRRFTWRVADALTPRALGVVGECCPLLQHLTLQGHYDLLALADAHPGKSPIFPVLETLRISSVQVPLESTVSGTRLVAFSPCTTTSFTHPMFLFCSFACSFPP